MVMSDGNRLGGALAEQLVGHLVVESFERFLFRDLGVLKEKGGSLLRQVDAIDLARDGAFPGQLIDELWQLKAEKSPLNRRGEATSVAMTDVDDVDGPPNPDIKDCATIIVGDPVQTHVIPSHQLTVTLPATEVLTGTGLGAHFRATGDIFALDHGVRARVFERTQPLTDADMEGLATRWRAARAAEGADR